MRIFYVALVVGGASFLSPVTMLAQSLPTPIPSTTPETPSSPPEHTNAPEKPAASAPPIVPKAERALPPTIAPTAMVSRAPKPWPESRPSMWGPLVDGRIRDEPYWYGRDVAWVLAPVDVGTVVLLASGQNELTTFGVANFFVAHTFVGPIFHWAYGYTARGFGALALNVMLPVIGGFTGSALGSSDATFTCTILGLLGAQTIDIFVLAHGTDRVYSHTPRKPFSWRPSAVGIVPRIDSQQSGLSIVGQF